MLIEQFCERKPVRKKQETISVLEAGDFVRFMGAEDMHLGDNHPPRRLEYQDDQPYNVLRVDLEPLHRGRDYYVVKCTNNEGEALGWTTASHFELIDRPEGWVGALPLLDRPVLTTATVGQAVVYRGHLPLDRDDESTDWGRRAGLVRGNAYLVRLTDIHETRIENSYIKVEGGRGNLWIRTNQFSPLGEMMTLGFAARNKFGTRRRSRRTFWREGHKYLWLGQESNMDHLVRELHPVRGWQDIQFMSGNAHVEVLQPEYSQVELPTP